MSEAMAINQRTSGPIQLTHFHTNLPPPGDFSNIDVLIQPPVPGSFSVVRESAGARVRDAVVFTYNADNTVRTVFVPFGNPAGFQNDTLGAINNNGSLFPFQGGAIGPVSPADNNYNVLWGDYFYIDPAGQASMDPDYPLSGLGGPIARCQSRPVPSSGSSFGRYAGPNAAGTGTSLYTRRKPLPVVFDDDFESGDVSVWKCTDE